MANPCAMDIESLKVMANDIKKLKSTLKSEKIKKTEIFFIPSLEN